MRDLKLAFEAETIVLPLASLLPLRFIDSRVRESVKYAQIRSSIAEIGLVEPPVVARDKDDVGKYLLLDGALRVSILRELGILEVACLIATDDEAFTYNKRISRLATVQERNMILAAIARGVSEDRIAKVLNINVAQVRRKKRLLDGMCAEAIELLNDRHVPIETFGQLKKMVPLRQIEAVQLMIAMNKCSLSYAKSLLAATPPSQLVDPVAPKRVAGLSEEQIALMERESGKLDREFHLVEQSYGADNLDLVVAVGFIRRLIENARAVRYLAAHFPELLAEFQLIVESRNAAA